VIDDGIRSVLAAEGRLLADPASLGEDTDLYEMGLTSHATVRVMIGLEEHFVVEFPDHLLRKDTFRSLGSIKQALETLGCV
jgi:acyl carrier protein